MTPVDAQNAIVEIDAKLNQLGQQLLNQSPVAMRLYGQRDILVQIIRESEAGLALADDPDNDDEEC